MTGVDCEALRAEVERLNDSLRQAQLIGLELATKASTAEAALLAKSAAYDALVARVEAAELATVDSVWAGDDIGTVRTILTSERSFKNGTRVRLLVSDDRPSHTAGEK